jgi:hypothetical protein
MNVGVDNEQDAHSCFFGSAHVELNVADRVHDSSGRLASAAKQIGDTYRIIVEELSEDHDMRSRSWMPSYHIGRGSLDDESTALCLAKVPLCRII